LTRIRIIITIIICSIDQDVFDFFIIINIIIIIIIIITIIIFNIIMINIDICRYIYSRILFHFIHISYISLKGIIYLYLYVGNVKYSDVDLHWTLVLTQCNRSI